MVSQAPTELERLGAFAFGLRPSSVPQDVLRLAKLAILNIISGILVSETDRLIALIGVEDIIVVDTPDALLVTTKEHAQRVKSLVDALKVTGHSDLL